MRKRILMVAIGASFLLAPTAFGDFNHLQYSGTGDYSLAMVESRLKEVGYLVANGTAVKGTRSKADKIQDSGEAPLTFSPGETLWRISGLALDSDAGDVDGNLTTKNGTVFKLSVEKTGSPAEGLAAWISAFVDGNGGNPVNVTKGSLKGKAVIDIAGDVKLALKISFSGTQAEGQNFGAKSKGKVKWTAVLTGSDPI